MPDDPVRNALVDALLRGYRDPAVNAMGTPQPIERNAMNVGPLTPMNKLLLDIGLTSQDPINDEGRRLALGLMGGVRGGRTGLGDWLKMGDHPGGGDLVQARVRYPMPAGDTRFQHLTPEEMLNPNRNPYASEHIVGVRLDPKTGRWIDRQGNPVEPIEWRPFAKPESQ